jgi:putative tricarboxylic transport membrane protein
MAKPPAGARSINRADLAVALVLFGLAGLVWNEAFSITRAVAYGVGPTAALKVVGVGLAILGVFTLINALRGRPDSAEPMAAGPVWLILAGCAVTIACIRLGGGFIPAVTILFVATATAFGRRKPAIDAAIGLAGALVIYLLFSKLLTLNLPQGPLERLIG